MLAHYYLPILLGNGGGIVLPPSTYGLTNLFARMSRNVLRLLGEPAVFEGTATRINIENGVQLTGIGGEEAVYRGDLVANLDVATISSTLNPRLGHQFTQFGKTYRLERLVEDNGYSKRYVVLEL